MLLQEEPPQAVKVSAVRLAGLGVACSSGGRRLFDAEHQMLAHGLSEAFHGAH